MLTKHFKYCSKCHNKLLTFQSKDYGVCFSCRNYKPIELKRLQQFNTFWAETLKLPERNRFEIYTKKTAIRELFLSKKNFIKTGYMIKPTQKREQEKIADVCIKIAYRDPRIEPKIQWVKYNARGKTRKLKK